MKIILSALVAALVIGVISFLAIQYWPLASYFSVASEKANAFQAIFTFLAFLVALPALIEIANRVAQQQEPLKHVDRNKWQALFLTNGQVYFGKVLDMNQYFIVLDKVFYITPSEGKKINPTNLENNLNLVPLGREVHGPEQKMYVSSNEISFWENLKTSSKVVKAIENFPGKS